MRKKFTSLALFRFFFVSCISLILLIILNFTSDYSLVKGVLSAIIIFFLLGYSLVNILFRKKPEIPETLVLSIGTSVAVFIIIAMGIHLAGIEISVENILNPVAATSFILGLLDLLKNVLLTKRLR